MLRYKRIKKSELCPGTKFGDTILISKKPKFVISSTIKLDYDGFPKSPPVLGCEYIIVDEDGSYFYLQRH